MKSLVRIILAFLWHLFGCQLCYCAGDKVFSDKGPVTGVPAVYRTTEERANNPERLNLDRYRYYLYRMRTLPFEISKIFICHCLVILMSDCDSFWIINYDIANVWNSSLCFKNFFILSYTEVCPDQRWQSVYCCRHQLTCCPQLDGEDQLRLLNYQHNMIRRIERLESLTRLVFLDFYDNQIDCISGLNSLRSLRVLMLGKNR